MLFLILIYAVLVIVDIIATLVYVCTGRIDVTGKEGMSQALLLIVFALIPVADLALPVILLYNKNTTGRWLGHDE